MNGTDLMSIFSPSLGQRQAGHDRGEAQYGIETLLRPTQECHEQPDAYWAFSNLHYLRRKLAACPDDINNAITMDVRIMHGNPVFRGTRVPVYQIVEELADGTSLTEILQGYPSLTIRQVQAGLDLAASLLRIYDEQIPD